MDSWPIELVEAVLDSLAESSMNWTSLSRFSRTSRRNHELSLPHLFSRFLRGPATLASFLSALHSQSTQGRAFESKLKCLSWYIGRRSEAWVDAEGQLFRRTSGFTFPEGLVSANHHDLIGQEDCLNIARRIPDLVYLAFELPNFERVTDPENDQDRFAPLNEEEQNRMLNIPALPDLLALPFVINLFSITICSTHYNARLRSSPALKDLGKFMLLAPSVSIVSLHNVDVASLGLMGTLLDAFEEYQTNAEDYEANANFPLLISGLSTLFYLSIYKVDPIWNDLAYFLGVLAVTLRMLAIELEYTNKEDRTSLRTMTERFHIHRRESSVYFTKVWRLLFSYPFSKQIRIIRYHAFFSRFSCTNLILILPANLGTKGQRRLLSGLKSSTIAPHLKHLEFRFSHAFNPLQMEFITPLLFYANLLNHASSFPQLKHFYLIYDLAQIDFVLWFQKRNSKYDRIRLNAVERARVKDYFLQEFKALDRVNEKKLDLRVEVKDEGRDWLTITRDYAGSLDVRERAGIWE